MILPKNPQRVYLAVGYTDMRKAINGLSIMVEQAMALNPFSGDLFVFCNRCRTIIKILYWDHNGFCLWHKRLEKHRFKWPLVPEEVVAIDARQLNWLLAGLDFTSAHERLYYSAVAKKFTSSIRKAFFKSGSYAIRAAMKPDLSSLPDDAKFSKSDITSLIDLVEQKYQEKVHYLEERIRLLQNELFGRKSEKRYAEDHLQLPIFEVPNAATPVAPSDQETIVVPAHKRSKPGRKPLPEDLPRVEIVHDLPEDEKVCQCGAQLSRIGQDTCEKLDYVPAKVRVLRHVRYKYACKSCQGVEDDGPTVKIAPVPVQLIEKSMATEGLLAHIVVSKFADALPLYRQQKIFARLGIDLPRATMANWMIQVAQRCTPLIELLEHEIRSGPLIQMDETPLQVLKEPGRSNTSKSYMWVFCGGNYEHPTVLYRYQPTRSGKVALAFLDEYEGYIQSDDYDGYDYLAKKQSITHLACWAHARRKFTEVIKARKKPRGSHTNVKTLADDALDYIGKLYQIEKQAREQEIAPEQIYALRQEKSKPILEAFGEWLEKTQPLTPPQGLLGIAINYALRNWSKLMVYIEDGHLSPDNNTAENAIRPFVLGRKNWLFAGAPNGADAGAAFFSLIETAKANRLEPYSYLRCLFERLPLVKDQNEYRTLLPQYIDPTLINSARP